MIKKQHRLRKNKHFQYIYRKGLSKQTRCLTVVFVKTHIQPFKVGFSVTKKVGKSVVRSRVKRVMTEAFNQILWQVNINYNYIFVAKPEILELSVVEIAKEMKTCLKKANLLNE